MSLEFLAAGPMLTVQDGGRKGAQAFRCFDGRTIHRSGDGAGQCPVRQLA